MIAIMYISNFIKILPVVVALKHADRHDQPYRPHFIVGLQRARNV